MKLKMFHIRILYENINSRPMSQLILASRILDGIDNSDYEIIISNVSKLLSEFQKTILTRSLPCEIKYLNDKEYKGCELDKDRKRHLDMFTYSKSLLTILEYRNFLSSVVLNYIVQRLTFQAKKNDDFLITKEIILSDIKMILTDEIKDVDKELSRQIIDRQNWIDTLLIKSKEQESLIESHSETIKAELLTKRDKLDIEYTKIFDEYNNKVRNFLQYDLIEVKSLLNSFTFKNDVTEIEGILTNYNNELLDYLNNIKLMYKDNLDKIKNKINMSKGLLECKYINEEDYNDLINSIEYLHDSIKNLNTNILNIKEPTRSLDNLKLLVNEVLTDTKTMSEDIQRIVPEIRRVALQSRYFIEKGEAIINNLEEKEEEAFNQNMYL